MLYPVVLFVSSALVGLAGALCLRPAGKAPHRHAHAIVILAPQNETSMT